MPDLTQNFRLGSRQFEAKFGQKGLNKPIITGAWPTARARQEFLPATQDGDLKFQEFIQSQALPAYFRLVQLIWEMDHVDGLSPGRQIAKDQVGKSVGDVCLEIGKRAPDE